MKHNLLYFHNGFRYLNKLEMKYNLKRKFWIDVRAIAAGCLLHSNPRKLSSSIALFLMKLSSTFFSVFTFFLLSYTFFFLPLFRNVSHDSPAGTIG